MGNLVACVGAGLGWCCCSAAASLFSSCCGNDKPTSVAPGLNSGRKRSVLLLLISIGLSFLYQYWVGPSLKSSYQNDLNPVLAYLSEAWVKGCEEYAPNGNGMYGYTEELAVQREKCAGNHGVYRVAGSAFLFYIFAAVAVYCKPSANREAWPAKFVLFLFLVVGTLFIPNEPLFSPILLNIFRVGGVLFIVFNQLIILDLAFNVNESWVEKADKAEMEEGEGAGKKWLGALLASCAALFVASLVAIGLMYHYFGGCGMNNVFITITLVLGIVLTGIQLSGEEASLLTSSCIFAYSTYLLYTALGRNPEERCNPQLGEQNVGGIILGLVVTLMGMAWTGYSYTAHRAVGEESDSVEDNDNNDDKTKGDKQDFESNNGRAPVSGVVMNHGESEPTENYGPIHEGATHNDGHVNTNPNSFSNSWKLNMILSLICCWYAMSLTSWGAVVGGGNLANPSAGKVSMWMIIGSQWLMNLLYLWMLIAPRLFPDRDFS